MAWERNFEKRVLQIREKELKFQRLNYIIEVCSPFPRRLKEEMNQTRPSVKVLWNGIWLVILPSLQLYLTRGNRNASPMVVTIVAFFHFAVIRNQTLTPSVAFTSVSLLSFGIFKEHLQWIISLL